MQISVVLVSYNVKYFLEQALLSVQRAAQGLLVEIIVVDNNSADGTIEMLQQRFGNDIICIANTQNLGFSVANNQAIRRAQGEYILLLNPDTIVQEDTLRHCLSFMDTHPEAGALGVAMFDGKGNFLPESKRGLPSPWVAFCKMSGLGMLFPHSHLFNHYYMGWLDPAKTHVVEVLSGAFMFMRRAALDQVGLLDETFFMYGEDIDLSYRIEQGGFANYYYPHTRIIHYKGESTKKGSLNYVRMFYQAMLIFAQKHFATEKARMYAFFIPIAIYLKAATTLLLTALQRALLPLADTAIIFVGMIWIKGFWQNNVKVAENIVYAPEYLLVNIPLYIVLWLANVYISGGYDRPFHIARTLRGIFLGTILISAVYGFLPEYLRFSRGMIVAGMLWAMIALAAIRIFFNFVQYRRFSFDEYPTRRFAIAGSPEECRRIHQFLHQLQLFNTEIVGYISPNDEPLPSPANLAVPYIGTIHNLQPLVATYRIEELIFSAKDIDFKTIIQQIIEVGQYADCKIVVENSDSIVGSNSKNSAGELYTLDLSYRINQPRLRRNKRLFDLGLAIALLLLLPVIFLGISQDNRLGLWRNIVAVFRKQKTWVGYAQPVSAGLPVLPKGVLSPVQGLPIQLASPAAIGQLNKLYAKDYTTADDWAICLRNHRYLGQF